MAFLMCAGHDGDADERNNLRQRKMSKSVSNLLVAIDDSVLRGSHSSASEFFEKKPRLHNDAIRGTSNDTPLIVHKDLEAVSIWPIHEKRKDFDLLY